MNPFKAIWNTIYNWRELWLWPLVAFINLEFLLFVAYVITGHWPQESMDGLVGLGMNILVVTLAISLTSILRESTGTWWTRAEQLASPHVIWSAMVGKTIAFVAILWALKH